MNLRIFACACFTVFSLAITLDTAVAGPRQNDEILGQLPTYSQLMSMSRSARQTYLRGVQKLLVELAKIGPKQPFGLVVENEEVRLQYNKYAALLQIMNELLPSANAYAIGDSRPAGTYNARGYMQMQYCWNADPNTGACSDWRLTNPATVYSRPGVDADGMQTSQMQYCAAPPDPKTGACGGGWQATNPTPQLTQLVPMIPGSGRKKVQYCAELDASTGQCKTWVNNDVREKNPADPAKPTPTPDPAKQDPTKADPGKTAATTKVTPQAGKACPTGKDKDDAVAAFRKDKTLNACIFAGNVSTTKTDRSSYSCKPAKHFFCLSEDKTQASCDKADLLTCKNKSQVACNPLVFGSVSKTEALCVDAKNDATQRCFEGSTNPSYNYIDNVKSGPLMERWNAFATSINNICKDPVSLAAHCTECDLLRRRIVALNTADPVYANRLIRGTDDSAPVNNVTSPPAPADATK